MSVRYFYYEQPPTGQAERSEEQKAYRPRSIAPVSQTECLGG